jgi:hypothetical protein
MKMKYPLIQVLTTPNLQLSRVERSRNLADWCSISPRFPYLLALTDRPQQGFYTGIVVKEREQVFILQFAGLI